MPIHPRTRIKTSLCLSGNTGIYPLEKHGLAVVAAIVEVIILVREKGRFSAGHGLVPCPGVPRISKFSKNPEI
jgi:hypothetical protein